MWGPRNAYGPKMAMARASAAMSSQRPAARRKSWEWAAASSACFSFRIAITASDDIGDLWLRSRYHRFLVLPSGGVCYLIAEFPMPSAPTGRHGHDRAVSLHTLAVAVGILPDDIGPVSRLGIGYGRLAGSRIRTDILADSADRFGFTGILLKQDHIATYVTKIRQLAFTRQRPITPCLKTINSCRLAHEAADLPSAGSSRVNNQGRLLHNAGTKRPLHEPRLRPAIGRQDGGARKPSTHLAG